MKKVIAGVTAVIIAACAAIGTGYFYNTSETSADTTEKAVTVERGNVTAGVTESASVEVQSLEQTYDLSLTTVNISASVEAGSSGMSSGGPGGAMDAGGMGGGGMPGMSGGAPAPSSSSSKGSTSVSSSSSSSSLALVVDEVCIKEGQTVSEGDVIMTITEDSINQARSELENGVSSAELALKQAEIDENEKLLTAKYEYDRRIIEGQNAQSNYDASLNEIASNIANLSALVSDLENQIANASDSTQTSQLSSQLESYRSQLDSAQSTRSADELSAKQTYEEAIMYYENAQSLYDVAVSDVGTAKEEAEENLSDAKSDLDAFNSYVSDGKILAEYSGTITSIGYAAGDTLSSETAIAGYADSEGITVTVNVTEDDISSVNLDDETEISFLSYPGETFSGYVSEIGSSSSSGNSSTVSYPVTVVVTTYPESVLSGMTASVTFVTKQVKDVLYVTNKAVITEGTQSYVIVRDENGNEEKRSVDTGFSNGKSVEISGVSEGETLIIKGR